MGSAEGFLFRSFAGCVLLGTIFFAGCGKISDPVPPKFFGKEYLPLTSGRYVEYIMDTVRYNILSIDTLQKGSELVRDVIGDSVFSGRNYVSYPVVRYTRANSSGPWRQSGAYQIAINLGTDVIRYSDGAAELLLRLPCQVNNFWDRNAYQAGGDGSSSRITVTAQGQATVGAFSFDSVLTLTTQADSNCLSSTRGLNQYAAGVGLIKQIRYEATFVQDPQNPCQAPVVYQRRIRREFTITGYGRR